MEQYKIREAEKRDSERIWEIRNNPLIRKISGNSNSIEFKDHEKWFDDKYFENRNNFCFVLVGEVGLIGYCRFDYDEEKMAHIVSIAIGSENHGRGLGIHLLIASLERLKDRQGDSVLAEVRVDNVASNRLFEKTGFEKYKEDKDNYYYRKMLQNN